MPARAPRANGPPVPFVPASPRPPAGTGDRLQVGCRWLGRGPAESGRRVPAEPGLAGAASGLFPVVDVELGEDGGDVVADRLRLDEQSLCDGVVAASLCKEAENLPLSVSE